MRPSSPAASGDIAQELAALWQRLLPRTIERLHLLDQASAAAAGRTLTPALQAEAAAIAHTFAGSLGMFGFHEGTRLAREIEQHWESPAPDPAVLAKLTRELRRSLPALQTTPSISPPEAIT